ncbi:MAG: lipase [Pseudomonadales bacterium]|nr:lipase [Pseudomonadales bacterium]NIX07416.1 lipase [Pseudomonadales bacterium]
MVRMPSGVRLAFTTDATSIALTFLATNMVTPPETRRPIPFDLEIEGALSSVASNLGNTILLDRARPDVFELVRGEPDTVVFDDLPPGRKQCELWLPHNAYVELRELTVDDGALLAEPAHDERPQWVHYGSSISHCMESDHPGLIWPAVAARRAGASLRNLGFGGQCHLDQFVARTIRDVDADAISIKTGINVINRDSMRERVFTPALHGFLDTVREGKPDTPIILISPIYCPSAESRPGPTFPGRDGRFFTVGGHEEIREGCLTLRRVREIIAEVVEQRVAGGDRALRYVDGLELFGEGDAADLLDDLHPNASGYVRMGERFASRLADVLGIAEPGGR